MHFTHLSLKNKYHLYSIENDKIVRDDYLMDFMHPDLIKCYYRRLPALTLGETKAIIIDLMHDINYKDMVTAFCYNIGYKLKHVKEGNKTEKVKELLKFIKRDFNFVV